MTSAVIIAPAEEKDFPAIQRIYAGYVTGTTVSLEEEPPSADELQQRWKKSTDNKLPYITAKMDGKLVGYAYAFPYRPRSAYRFTVEESVYVDAEMRGAGIGHLLMDALIADCRKQGSKQLVAVIAGTDNVASIAFHEAKGFVQVGTLRNVGFKFGKWIDTILMQKAL